MCVTVNTILLEKKMEQSPHHQHPQKVSLYGDGVDLQPPVHSKGQQAYSNINVCICQ